MGPNVVEITATIFSLYFNSFRCLKQVLPLIPLAGDVLSTTVCLQLGYSLIPAFFQCASGNTRAKHLVICDPSTPGASSYCSTTSRKKINCFNNLLLSTIEIGIECWNGQPPSFKKSPNNLTKTRKKPHRFHGLLLC